MGNFVNEYDKAQAKPPLDAQASQPPADEPRQSALPDEHLPLSDQAIPAHDPSPCMDFKERLRQKLFEPKPGVSPTRQKAMVILIPLLFVILVFMMVRLYGPSSTTAAPAAQPRTTTQASQQPQRQLWQKPGAWPEDIRDPMKPLGGEQERQMPEIDVSGIFHGSEPSAIINGHLVRQGQEFEGMRIMSITSRSIEFQTEQGQTWIYQVE